MQLSDVSTERSAAGLTQIRIDVGLKAVSANLSVSGALLDVLDGSVSLRSDGVLLKAMRTIRPVI